MNKVELRAKCKDLGIKHYSKMTVGDMKKVIAEATKVAKLEKQGTGLTIEKDRPTQNGITRPSSGGKCRVIWDMLDDYVADPENEGEQPTPSVVRAIAAEEGWSENNAIIEFYQWRRFNGISGRQKKGA